MMADSSGGHSERIWYMMKAMDDGRQLAAQRESNGLGVGGDRDTVREESKVGSVWVCWGLGVGTVCGTVLFGCLCVRVCSISPQTFQTGVFMFELRSRNSLCVYAHLSSSIRDRGLYVWTEIENSLCVAVCCVVCVCMFHLSSNIRDRGLYVWAELVKGLWLCGSLSQSLLIWEREWLVVVYCEVQVWPYSYF